MLSVASNSQERGSHGAQPWAFAVYGENKRVHAFVPPFDYNWPIKSNFKMSMNGIDRRRSKVSVNFLDQF